MESKSLQRMDDARKALDDAKDLNDILKIKDIGMAAREYAKAAKLGLDVKNKAAEIILRAERKAGEYIKQLERNQGKRNDITLSDNGRSEYAEMLNDVNAKRQDANRWQKIADIPESIFENIITETKEAEKELTESMMLKVEKEISAQTKKEEKIFDIKKAAKNFKDENIIIKHIDFKDYKIDDNTIDLVLTDPPYPGKYLNLWEDLFAFSFTKLKPSSFLIAYSGQMYLDKIFSMHNDLIYYWTMNIVFSKKPLIMGRNIINEWKPILIFQKPPFKKISDTISDTISFDYSERDMHNNNWGQTIKPFELLIERFTNPNDLIFEPFAGTGTTLIAAKNKSRKCIGCEIDEQYIDLIKGRLV